MTRLRAQSGQSTVEFSGMVFWVLLAALFAWQLALVGWTAVSATNAARTAARMASRGESQTQAEQAGQKSLTGGLGRDATVSVQNDVAVVRVVIPLVFPWFHPVKKVYFTERAYMPYTG